MANIENIRSVGASLYMFLDNGTSIECAPTQGGFWIPTRQPGGSSTTPPGGGGGGENYNGFIFPFPTSSITEDWMTYTGHNGTDFAQPPNTPIKNPGPTAKVAVNLFGDASNGWTGLGNFTILDHGTFNGHHLWTGYAHQIRLANVTVGQTIKSGEQFGNVGTTGNSTGEHLHWMTMVDSMNGAGCINPHTFVATYPKTN